MKGERVEKDVGGNYTEYVFGLAEKPEGEYNRTSWTDTWVTFEGRHFAHFSNGDTYFVHADRIGTTNIVTDWNTGTVVQDELHYPWGQVWTTAGSSIEERFASLQHRDSESNLDPTEYRMFSSDVGRWTTPDPADQWSANPLNPQSWNRYGYASENPAGNTDPYGLMACNPNYYYSCSTWGGSDCQMDGIGVSCGFAQDMLDAGVALTCDYYCGEQTVYEGNLTSIRSCDATTEGWSCSQTTPTYLGMSLAQFQAGYYNQLNATAAALLTAGESAEEVNAFKAANSSPDWALVANQGGNFDFPVSQTSGPNVYNLMNLQGDTSACPNERCDEWSAGTLDFSHNDGTFHLDTSDPYTSPSSALEHFGIDVIGGTVLWSGGIRRY